MRQSSGGSKVPPPPSVVANILSAWVELEHEFMDVYAEHKAVIFAVYAIGLVAGVCALLVLRFVFVGPSTRYCEYGACLRCQDL